MRAPESTGLPEASVELLAAAVQGMGPAALESDPERRSGRAQLVALRAGAAVLAAHARADAEARRPRSVWTMLCGISPELREWAEFFALSERIMQQRRKLTHGELPAVTAREADDLVRDARRFVDVVVEYLTRRSRTAAEVDSQRVAAGRL